jgi:hypothetical protein
LAAAARLTSRRLTQWHISARPLRTAVFLTALALHAARRLARESRQKRSAADEKHSPLTIAHRPSPASATTSRVLAPTIPSLRRNNRSSWIHYR